MYSEKVNPDANQVFLCMSQATLPFSFAIHPWFVVNKQGDVSRWEFLAHPQQAQTSWGHIHKDAFPYPFSGINMFPYSDTLRWPSTIRDSITGKGAKYVIEVIETTPKNYPYPDTYKLLGPNSNTYAQWILNNCPDFDTTLPVNAIGKRYL